MARDLNYWYDNVSMLGYKRLIKKRLPLIVRMFARIHVDCKYYNAKERVIRVYFSFNPKEFDAHFCCEFTAEELEKESKGKATITAKS